MARLAAILDAERQRQGLTLSHLAKSAGMSAGQLQRVLRAETVNPGLFTVRDILKGLGKSLTWLDRQLNRGGQ